MDRLNRVIWLVDSTTADATPFCRTHADRLTAPDDWRLVDQRDPTTTLWPDESFEVVRRSTRRSRRSFNRRPLGGWAQPQLTRQMTTDQPSLFDDTESDPLTSARQHAAASIGPLLPDPGEHNPLLEVTSPLLARAFRGVRLTTSTS